MSTLLTDVMARAVPRDIKWLSDTAGLSKAFTNL